MNMDSCEYVVLNTTDTLTKSGQSVRFELEPTQSAHSTLRRTTQGLADLT